MQTREYRGVHRRLQSQSTHLGIFIEISVNFQGGHGVYGYGKYYRYFGSIPYFTNDRTTDGGNLSRGIVPIK